MLLLTLLSLPFVGLFGFFLWVFVKSSALVDARLEEARNRVPSRVYSRPVSVRTNDQMDVVGLVSILNALSYQDTPNTEPGPGEFKVAGNRISLKPRGDKTAARPGELAASNPTEEVSLTFEKTKTGADIVKTIKAVKTDKDMKVLTLEPVLISYLFEGEEREKRRFVKYDELPRHLVEAVLAIEDRRFFQHPGFDPFRIVGAALRNLKPGGNLQGGSTLTQQFVKNFFQN